MKNIGLAPSMYDSFIILVSFCFILLTKDLRHELFRIYLHLIQNLYVFLTLKNDEYASSNQVYLNNISFVIRIFLISIYQGI